MRGFRLGTSAGVLFRGHKSEAGTSYPVIQIERPPTRSPRFVRIACRRCLYRYESASQPPHCRSLHAGHRQELLVKRINALVVGLTLLVSSPVGTTQESSADSRPVNQ